MKILKNFVVFEGCDGSGTTTQLSQLSNQINVYKDFKYSVNTKIRHKKIDEAAESERQYLDSEKPILYPTSEPTNGPIGTTIRSALKKTITLNPQTLAMLFAADRNEHLYCENGIIEHIKKGELVVSDRYVLSSLVYQGIECGDKLPKALNSGFPAPEIMFFFDIQPEIAFERIKNRPSHEIYEYHTFQVKVREKYKSLLEIYQKKGVKVEIIDASLDQDDVSRQIWDIIKEMPIFKV